MNVVFLSRLYLPHLGGVEIHVREISAILTRMGHEVTVITLQHDAKLKSKTEYDGVKVIRLSADAQNKHDIWQAIISVKESILQADIIHVHDVFWWILPLYVKIKKKVFITFHGWETQFPIPLNSKIHRFLVSKLAQGTIHVGAFIQKFYWDKPTFITYGGINPKRFTKSNSSKAEKKSTKLKFVFVGRLEHDTDVLMYIDFLKELQVKNIAFEMVWVGDGFLKKECEQFGIVTGFVKNISQHIVIVDFVFASSYLSILEAQCLEKIVLSFYSNPLKKEYLETYPGNKYMVIAGSVESMIAKFEHMLTSQKLLPEMKKAAKQFALMNTWDKVVDQYLQLWKKK
ncbi:MAG: glycosyl transferase [Patescibacteria group bacterium]|nr:MAG: glycosyl transferase [Patescibacteria group bacterium]